MKAYFIARQIERAQELLRTTESGTAPIAAGEERYRAPADAIGKRGIEAVEQQHDPWPCGVVNGGETSGLLLGLAGIGYFYLRLFDSKRVPSMLLIAA